MKILCLLVLFNISFCIGEEASEKEKYWRDIIYGGHGYDYDVDKNQDKEKDKDPIIRPCPKDDLKCIGTIFAINSLCPTIGLVSDPYEIDSLSMEIPHSDLSVTVYNAKIKGFSSGKIKEFFINKETNTLVLEVIFDSIIVNSPKTVFKHYRRGKEPVIKVDSTEVELKSLSITLTIANRGSDKLKVYVYSDPSNDIPFKGITDSTDLDVIRHNKKLLDNMPLSVREALVTNGPVIISLFLQKKVCNFGYHSMK